MPRNKRVPPKPVHSWAALIILIAIGTAPCRYAEASAGTPADRATLVFAAASLANAFEDIAKLYAARGAGEVKMSFLASNVLARQIETGAPADIFVSADAIWMDHIAARGLLVDSTRRNLLGNALVLIAGRDSADAVEIMPGLDLVRRLGGGKLAIGEPDSVPAGIYAKAALTRLGVWDSLAGRLAPAENVRAALLYVALGECPLGIVYRTDALVEPKVKIVGVFPADSHPPIVYSAAMLKTGKSANAAIFYEFLGSSEADEVFRKYGFDVLE